MRASVNAINLIKQFEGFSAKPYRCPAGVATIGYGTTSYSDGTRVRMTDSPITELEATEELKDHLRGIESGLSARLGRKLNQNQFDALVSFAYNLGLAALEKSTLYKYLFLANPNYTGASREFSRWVYADGKKLEGLVKRREAERALFDR